VWGYLQAWYGTHNTSNTFWFKERHKRTLDGHLLQTGWDMSTIYAQTSEHFLTWHNCVVTFINNAVPQQITKCWESWHSLYISLIWKEPKVRTQETSKMDYSKCQLAFSNIFSINHFSVTITYIIMRRINCSM
jgi:hypothetical protein